MPSQTPGNPPAVQSHDPAPPPAALLRRHNAVVLEPALALQLPGQKLRPTVYVADRLLIAFRPDGTPDDVARDYVKKAAGAEGLVVAVTPRDGYELAAFAPPMTVPAAVDAWRVLQTARGLAAQQKLTLDGVGLDHLVQVSAPVSGAPFDSSNRPPPLAGASVYDRAPVAWAGPAPVLPDPVPGTRSPVVALVDTGCAPHPWLPDSVVTRNPGADGVPAGLPDAGQDGQPDVLGPLDGHIDTFFGHGTFSAGLVRQVCPQARVLSVRLLGPDGAATESDLVSALRRIHALVLAAQTLPGTGQPVDVLSLSCGFYPESLTGLASSALTRVLGDLARIGVTVVAAAGNDATTRERMPALLTPYSGGVTAPAARGGDVPLISAGALNPDGTIALFSNTSGPGGWVCEFAPGAALVSAMPAADAGANPPYSRPDPAGGTRADLDPDHFGAERRPDSDGRDAAAFARWSGTSFAAPVIASRIARALPPILSTSDSSGAQVAAVARAWTAIGSAIRRYAP
ncbi:MAG: hypothetical protein QOJ50_72 [Cryptosporangiaceae bacterium]|nr:hypothetical protein [Cryptosporangiaceae bacterium]